VQTVSPSDDAFLHRLLCTVADRTGVPVLLNTSFNDREPIVESPTDALRCLLCTGIDVLFLEDARITKQGRDAR
jgi:carbamoyltransferase